MGDENTQDVKLTGAESSTAKQDAIETTENRQDVKQVEDKSLSDFVSETLKQQSPDKKADTDETPTVEENEEASTETSTEDEETVKKEEEGHEAKDKEESKAEDETKEENPDAKHEEAVPYERFQEVNKAKVELETWKKTTEPEVQNYRNITEFCKREQISAERFEQAMRVQALLCRVERGEATPEEALKHIMPIVESLQTFTGDRLPKDLQEKVDAEKMDLETAQELARLRGQAKYGEARAKSHQQQMEAERQARLAEQLNRDAEGWETDRRKIDPDYKPKAKDSDADGKWEMVRDKYMALLHQTDNTGNFVNPVKTSQDMLKLMDKAYASVDAMFKSIRGVKPATRRTLSSTSSSNLSKHKSIEQAETMQEAIALTLAKNGRS